MGVGGGRGEVKRLSAFEPVKESPSPSPKRSSSLSLELDSVSCAEFSSSVHL